MPWWLPGLAKALGFVVLMVVLTWLALKDPNTIQTVTTR